MNIVISKSYLNSVGIKPSDLYLNDQYCRPTYSYYDLIFNFPINTCGTVRKVLDAGFSSFTTYLLACDS